MHHRCVMVRRRFLRRVMLHLPPNKRMPVFPTLVPLDIAHHRATQWMRHCSLGTQPRPIARAMPPLQDLSPRQVLYVLRVWMSVLSVAMMFGLHGLFSRLLALIAASLAFLASAMRLSACLFGTHLRQAQSFFQGTRHRRTVRSLHSFAGTATTLRSGATLLRSPALILSRRLDG